MMGSLGNFSNARAKLGSSSGWPLAGGAGGSGGAGGTHGGEGGDGGQQGGGGPSSSGVSSGVGGSGGHQQLEPDLFHRLKETQVRLLLFPVLCAVDASFVCCIWAEGRQTSLSGLCDCVTVTV